MGWLKVILLVASCVFAVSGFAISYYLNTIDHTFLSGLLLNVSTVFVEVAVVVVVIEQIIRGAESRKWRFAERMISRTLCSAYLDIMRVLYARELPEGHQDRDGLSEFISVTDHHLSILRSYIEGFAPYLNEAVHEAARRSEAVLRSFYRHFKDAEISTREGFRLDSGPIFAQMPATCRQIYDFSATHNAVETKTALAEVRSVTADDLRRNDSLEVGMGLLRFMGLRWRWQDKVLEQYLTTHSQRGTIPLGIRYDPHDELALWYLLLDHLAFSEAAKRQGGAARQEHPAR